MSEPVIPSLIRRWTSKFVCAFSGLSWAIRTQNSFWVHLPMATAVLVLAVTLELDTIRLATLVLAIGIVLAAELFNTALEQLVAVLHPERDPRIGRVLDTAAGAVLITAVAATAVGLLVLLPPLLSMLYGML